MARGPLARARSASEWDAALMEVVSTLENRDNVFTSSDLFKNDQRLLRLPTIEAQLATWIRGYEQGRVSRCVRLQRAAFTLYARCLLRDIEDVELVMLDIAAVQVPEKFRGRGWFRSFCQIAEALNPWHATYYEMVHNERLAAHLQSAGYKGDTELCYYKIYRNPAMHDKES